MTTDRRAFIIGAGATVAGAVAVGAVGLVTAPHPGALATATLDGVNTPQFAELTPFKDPLRTPVTLRPSADGITEIAMVDAAIRLHSQLPPTRMWTYNGHFPGPTVETRKGQPVRIAWTNKLTGTCPVKAVWMPGDGRVPVACRTTWPGQLGRSPALRSHP